MKSRFDGLDVTAMVGHLHSAFLDRRVLNVYDGGDAETYIIKFDKGIEEGKGGSADGDAGSRGFVLIESGKRFHPLDHFQSEASVMPSPFAAKLRKHLKGLRASRIFQVGRDRVVVFSFSSFHLILELYDRGNVILCDSSYTIVALLRSHVYTNKAVKGAEAPGAGDKPSSAEVAVQVGHVYPVSYASKISDQPAPVGILADDFLPWVQEQLANTSQRKKKKNALTLKTLVLQSNSGVSHYGPALLEHCILTAGLDPHSAIVDEEALQSIQWPSLRSALLVEGQRILDSLKKGAAKGYIRYTESASAAGEVSGEAPPATRLFQEYLPCLFSQHSDALIREYTTFGDAVQDFYQQLVEQKASQRTNQLERAAHDKLEKIRLDQAARVATLQQEQQQLQLQAQLLQQHASSVDAALTVVNSALNSGMDWVQLSQLVQVEQNAGNPIACLIHALDLERDAMTLILPQPDNETESALVTVSLKETAHSNASILFSRYRAAKEKTAKTLDSTALALKAAEANAKRQIEAAQKRLKSSNAAAIAAAGQRKPAWFEKFHWFITSDNYLVLGGKDAHQNELLVKRYLRPGDAYLHADVFGSTSTILRAKRQRTPDGKTKPIPLPDQALREAGNFTICRSSAWSSRMVTSAWWVESHQVSKTAPTGEYLTVGSFMIRGKKNFLPPASLEMVNWSVQCTSAFPVRLDSCTSHHPFNTVRGSHFQGLAVLFRLGDDASLERHKNDRRDFALLAIAQRDSEKDELPVHEEELPVQEEEPPSHSAEFDQSAPSDPRDSHLAVNVEPISQLQEEESERETITSEPLERPSVIDGSSVQHGDAKVDEPAKKKKGISARDRKLIKKYGSIEKAEKRISFQREEQAPPRRSESSESSAKIDSARAGLKRGKKAKLKKIKGKYDDQDDEDRELAMLALQGGEKSKKKRSQPREPTENQRRVAVETSNLLNQDAASVASRLPDEVRGVLAECVDVRAHDASDTQALWDNFDASTLEQLVSLEPLGAQIAAVNRLRSLTGKTRIDNLSASLGGVIRAIRRYGFEGMNVTQVDEKDLPKSSIVTQVDVNSFPEEDVLEVDGDNDAIDDSSELNKLTGKPQLEDVLLFAVPVCAPYQTLSQYSYRVKLTPGSTKRGKAVKQCLDMLSKMEGVNRTPLNERCVALLKKIGENDWVQTICPDVKISAPGASKAAKKQKAKHKTMK